MPGWGVIPAVRVTDIAATLAFYVDRLGFTLERGGPTADTSVVTRGDARMMLEVAADLYGQDYNEAIRRDGYTWALEEFDEGISSVAAPVADASGEVVAAVHLHGPSYRFPSPGSEDALADDVVATAARISGSLRQAG